MLNYLVLVCGLAGFPSSVTALSYLATTTSLDPPTSFTSPIPSSSLVATGCLPTTTPVGPKRAFLKSAVRGEDRYLSAVSDALGEDTLVGIIPKRLDMIGAGTWTWDSTPDTATRFNFLDSELCLSIYKKQPTEGGLLQLAKCEDAPKWRFVSIDNLGYRIKTDGADFCLEHTLEGRLELRKCYSADDIHANRQDFFSEAPPKSRGKRRLAM